MPKNTLKDKLEGNELDLSLSSLDVVPVKELKEIPRATHLDLSCNLLVTITPEFSSLSHLVRLDLSKNKLTSLPHNIGNLAKLQYLDLFQNELTTLPVSMCRLGKLRWLDVKDNPLFEALKEAGGDCLNEKQCMDCAKRIVAFMKQADAQQERDRQARLQAERAEEKKRKDEEEKEREKVRQMKKQEKERRRKVHEEKLRLEREKAAKATAPQHHNGDAQITQPKITKPTEKSGFGCCGVLLAFLFGLAAVLTGVYFYCSSHTRDAFCVQASAMSRDYISEINTTLQVVFKQANMTAHSVFSFVDATVQDLIDKSQQLLKPEK